MAKTALVVSGGGSKGAFAVGVVKQLSIDFPDLNFDILVGTSTGALIVPMVAIEQLDLLEQVYTTVKTEDIVLKGNIGFKAFTDKAIYNTAPLGHLILDNYTDARCHEIFNSVKEVYIATTCLQTEKIVYFSNKNMNSTVHEVIRLNDPGELRLAIMASASQPVFMEAMEVQPDGKQYVDGGVREYAGLQLAIDAGAEEIYVVLLSTGKSDPSGIKYNSVFNTLMRTMDIFITDVSENDLRGPAVYNKALRYIDAVRKKMIDDGIPAADVEDYFTQPLHSMFSNKKPLKIHVIRPSTPLGGGPGGFDFNPQEMQGMLAKGKMTLSSYMAGLGPDGGGNV